MKKLNILLLTTLLTVLSFAQTRPALAEQPEPPSIAKAAYKDALIWKAPLNTNSATPRYATVPADMPLITVTVPASNTAEGSIFLATFAGAKSPYLLIVDNQGEPIFYQQFPAGVMLTDFKRQPNGNLSYFQGVAAVNGGDGDYHELDTIYALTRTWQATNTLVADNHDLQMLPDGNALLISYDKKKADFSAYGGLTNTLFIDCVIQGIRPDGRLAWEWRQSQHFAITDTYEDITGAIADPFHMNAVESDQDGNVLISSRHLSEITKINRATGDVIWRLGGKGNQFTFVNDDGFSYQHDIRRLPNGNITLWDNGNQKAPPYSRAVEFQIDESTKVITKVWEYRQTPDVYGFFMGNIQRLPNANSFLGWGGPKNLITEVGPDGSKRFEMTVDASAGYIYRAYRFPWSATPATTPTLVLTDVVAGEPALHFSWNGATDISGYRIEGWNLSRTLTQTADISRTGFENSVLVSSLPEFACYLRVMPLNKAGHDTRYSDVVYRGGAKCDAQISIAVHIPLLLGTSQ